MVPYTTYAGNADQTKWCWLACFFGLISQLYVPTPVGFVAMLDMVTYALGSMLLLTDFQRYDKRTRLVFGLAFLWLLGGIASDFYRGTPGKIMLKENMIIYNAITSLAVGFWLFRKSPRSIPFYFAAAAVSSFISLYKFQNGALLSQAVRAGYEGTGGVDAFLVDKMRYPIYISIALSTIVMPLRLKGWIPWFVCVAGYVGAGLFVLVNGGSRSNCLIFLGSAGLTFLYVYMPKMLVTLFKHKMRALILGVLAALLANFAYQQAAKAGLLGEEGMAHYEAKKSGDSTFLDDRADVIINWPFLWRNPIFGAGSEFLDRWGYVNKSPYVLHVDKAGHYINHEKFLGHSVIVGQWTKCGLLGFIYWAFVIASFIGFLGERATCLVGYGPFFICGIVGSIWTILFSPYGGNRTDLAFMMAFVTLMFSRRFAEYARQSFAKYKV